MSEGQTMFLDGHLEKPTFASNLIALYSAVRNSLFLPQKLPEIDLCSSSLNS